MNIQLEEHKILVIDSEATLKQKVEYLRSRGFEVDCVQNTSEAFEKLSQAKQAPYSLAMAVCISHKMKGEDILGKAKRISPDTQRLLIADRSDFQIFVHAINSAHIHACMPLPFSDEELYSQVKLRYSHFQANRKYKKLQKTTQRQNTQLHQIAKNFKKKETLYSAQFNRREKELRILKSRFRATFGLADDDQIDLRDVLQKMGVHFNPTALGKAFPNLIKKINRVMEIILSKHGIPLPSPPWESLIVDLSERPDLKTDDHQSVIRQVIHTLFKLIAYKEAQSTRIYEDVKFRDFSKYLSLQISDNKIRAHLSVKADAPDNMALFHVKRFLEFHKINIGVKPDSLIEEWLCDETLRKKPLLIAQGNEPTPSKNAKVDYYFPTHYLHPGKINPDGSIDFRDRGDIPQVNSGELLASKIQTEKGRIGINVLGEKVPVAEAIDQGFSAGIGTQMSGEENKIYATVDGQPHLDPLGVVSVFSEYQIKGDIGFETGNIEFDGNVIISGSVKQGFKVKCASLTAKEISGGEIDVSGNLNVSMGIVDSKLVNVKGTIQAMFVRNSKINAFGDLIVQKEIIDSEILLSGACINANGLILNSRISAKMGIRGGIIGNESSQPAILTVGVDEHINFLVDKIESELILIGEKIRQLTDEIFQLEKENHDLHAIISQNAYVQDRSQLKILDLEKNMTALDKEGNQEVFKRMSRQIQELSQKAKKAEEEIGRGFERQDEISFSISGKKLTLEEIGNQSKNLIENKRRLLEVSSQKSPLPEVEVSKHIESRTRIFTKNTQKTLSQSASRCRIKEVAKSFDGGKSTGFYEINVENY